MSVFIRPTCIPGLERVIALYSARRGKRVVSDLGNLKRRTLPHLNLPLHAVNAFAPHRAYQRLPRHRASRVVDVGGGAELPGGGAPLPPPPLPPPPTTYAAAATRPSSAYSMTSSSSVSCCTLTIPPYDRS